MKFRDLSASPIAGLAAAASVALALAVAPITAQAQATVRVASKNFTEQFVLAELYSQAFEAAGMKVERKINLGGTLIVHKALEEKQIDFYPEYTGTMLTAVLKMDPMTDRAADSQIATSASRRATIGSVAIVVTSPQRGPRRLRARSPLRRAHPRSPSGGRTRSPVRATPRSRARITRARPSRTRHGGIGSHSR